MESILPQRNPYLVSDTERKERSPAYSLSSKIDLEWEVWKNIDL
jgi:hypothetical protein